MIPELLLTEENQIIVDEDELLGIGNQGIVHAGLILYEGNPKQVAIKRYHIPQPWESKVLTLFAPDQHVLPLHYGLEISQLPPEIAALYTHKLLWQQANIDAHIITPLAIVRDNTYISESRIAIATELINGMPANRANIYNEDPSYQLNLLRSMVNIVSGLAISKKHGLQHRDIKPANVIVGETGIVKAIDFGYSADDNDINNVGGSPLHTCPEYIKEMATEGRCLSVDSYGMMRVLVEATLPKSVGNEQDRTQIWRRATTDTDNLLTLAEKQSLRSDIAMVVKAGRLPQHDNDLYSDYERQLLIQLSNYYQQTQAPLPPKLNEKVAVMGRIARTELTVDKNKRFSDPYLAMTIFLDIWRELLGHKDVFSDYAYQYGRAMIDPYYDILDITSSESQLYSSRLSIVRRRYSDFKYTDPRTLIKHLRKRNNGSIADGITYTFNAYSLGSSTEAQTTQVINIGQPI